MEGVLKDEREDVQKKTFSKWVNSQLGRGNEALVTDLFYDLRDGTKLLALLEILTSNKYTREKGSMRVHRLSNVRKVLDILDLHYVKLVNISADHIVDGSPKITLGLVWAIILHWQVQGVLKEVMANLQQTSLEKTLLAWCRQTVKSYCGVDVRNFSNSWSDGLAFNALLHSHRPELFEWSSLANKVPYARLQHAFTLAHQHLAIDKLLDPEDVHTQSPDKKSVMMYVMCLFQALPHSQQLSLDNLNVSVASESSLSIETEAPAAAFIAQEISPPPSGSSRSERPLSLVSAGLSSYLRSLEEVLVWLLGAEERLAAMPLIGDNTAILKDQFHDLEAVMLELTEKQGGVGEVLGEGTRLVREGLAVGEEGEEVKRQMKLLNTRWEDLRIKAMDRQSKLHVKLMKLQQEELDSLKRWLSSTEDRIANMSQIGPLLSDLKGQLEQHRKLQRDLESEQSSITALSNMVVVVDDPASDAAYSELEDELSALGERWSHVCKWSEHHWATLQALTLHWEELDHGLVQLKHWLDDKEAQLRQMESNPSMDDDHILTQAALLQQLQCELEVRHEQCSSLQEQVTVVLSGLPESSPAHTDIPRIIEDMQDRWDCLLSIIDAQKTRLASCGIDVSTVVVIGGSKGGRPSASTETTGDTTTSTTTTKTMHGTTIVTRVITTKSISTQESSGPEGNIKRQKLDLSSKTTTSSDSITTGTSESKGDTEMKDVAEAALTSADTADKELTGSLATAESLSQMLKRLESIESRLLPSATLNHTDKQLEDLQQSVKAELSSYEPEYVQLTSSSDYSAAREGGKVDTSTLQQQLLVQWKAVHNMLARLRAYSSLEGRSLGLRLQQQLKELQSEYTELQQWLDDSSATWNQGDRSHSACSKLQVHKERAERGKSFLEQLSEEVRETGGGSDDGSAMCSDLAALLQSWPLLCHRYSDFEKLLSKSGSPSRAGGSVTKVEEVDMLEVVNMNGASGRKVVEKIETIVQEVLEVQVEGIEGLESWLKEVEQELNEAPSMDVLVNLRKQQTDFRGHLSRVIAEIDRLTSHKRVVATKMSSSPQSSCPVTNVSDNLAEVSTVLTKALDKCSIVKESLEQRLTMVSESIEELEHHHEEVKGLQSWLGEVKVFLKAEEDQVLGRGNLETLKAQLQQSNALQDDIVTLSSNLSSVEQTCVRYHSSDPATSAALQQEARDTAMRLRTEWDYAVSQASILNHKLTQAVKKREQSASALETLSVYLTGISVPAVRGIETSGDLRTAVTDCQNLQQQLQDKQLTLDLVADDDEGASMRQQYSDVSQRVQERLSMLQTAIQQYESFKEASSAENHWLSELEQKLLLWSKPAADAEEISAKLDELESYLRGHGGSEAATERLDQVTEALLQHQVMTVAVQNSKHNIATKRKTLLAKSELVQRSLETASVTAQESEQRYLSILEHLTSLQHMLDVDQQHRIPAQQMEREVSSDAEGLRQLRDQVQVYLSEGNQPAADRLTQQLHLLQCKYDEVVSNLREAGLLKESGSVRDPATCASLQLSSPMSPRSAVAAILARQPDDEHKESTADSVGTVPLSPAASKRVSVELCSRVEELRARLHGTGERTGTLSITSTDPGHVQEQLNLCLNVYRELSEVKSSVEGTLSNGRRLVKENLTSQPHTLSTQLDTLKALYNQLGSQVTQQRGELEEGVQQARKLERDLATAEKLLTATEQQLRDATAPSQHNIKVLQQCLEELRLKRPLLTGACESYNYLAGLAVEGSLAVTQTKVEELEKRWDLCYASLNDKASQLKATLEQKEGEMSEFILRLADIKAWLEGSERKLAQDLSQPDKVDMLKVLSEEVVEYGSAVDSIKSAGASHISHGTLYHDNLNPELADITRRWENIKAQVKKQESVMSGATSVPQLQPKQERETELPKKQARSVVSATSSLQARETVTAGVASSSSTTLVTTTTAIKTSFRTTTGAQLRKMSGEIDDVSLYLSEVSALVDKIAAIHMKAQVVPVVCQAVNNAEALEQEVCGLEPDVATVISRGDSLTLSTHSWDQARARTVEDAVKDLRASWAQLKTQTEAVKAESEKVSRELSSSSERVNNLVSWLNDVSKRLHLLNNDDTQVKILEKELQEKRVAVEELNNTAALLSKYRHQQLLPSLAVVNSRWAEVTALFRQYSKDGALPYKNIQQKSVDASVVPQYITTVNKARETVASIAAQATSPKHPYQDLQAQAALVKRLQERLSNTKEIVERVETERAVAIKGSAGNAQQTDQVRRVTDNLRQEWAQVNRAVSELHACNLEQQAAWHGLHNCLSSFGQWLNEAQDRLNSTRDEPLPQAKLTQKELEKQVTLKHRVSQSLQLQCSEVCGGLAGAEAGQLQQRVDAMLRRWKMLLQELANRRERISSEGGGSGQYESLSAWLEQAAALLQTPVNVTDEAALTAHTTMVQNHVCDMNSRKQLLKTLCDVQPAIVSQQQLTEMQGNMDKLSQKLPEYQNCLEMKLNVIRNLLDGSEDLYRWTEKVRVRSTMQKTQLPPASKEEDSKDGNSGKNPVLEQLEHLQKELDDRASIYETLDSTYWVLAHDAESKGLLVDSALKKRMSIIDGRLKVLPDQVLAAKEQLSQQAAVDDMAVVLQNVIRFEESVLATDAGGMLTPPSPLLRTPTHPHGTSPSLILASLDKSILQIRDWLTVVEQMSRQQTVMVGDMDDVRNMTEKQKNVLRELEGKKPQLDDLVASADSLKDDASKSSKLQQQQQHVSKLREHWDETNSAVLARKTQLDAMLADSHKLETKRAEVEAWLQRMEHRLDRSQPVAHTADLLDQQIREQKGQQGELQQYKHQLELLNQQTQRLVAIYQQDDTRLIRRRGDALNARFNNLQANIMMRGQSLHSAMNSISNWDKAMDKLQSWLSDAEQSSSVLELETESAVGPPGQRRDQHPHVARSIAHLKDLQSEIESHKDVVASLNATGQKLLGTLENQDEAIMLHRRLEEMNTRWNTLKHRSIAIRSRLEGNSESWNSLLLSLRELIEWVIRKDTELTSMGTANGDLTSLAKMESDLIAYRRILDEKQPVVESNLKSGRQLIASEPPLSSDTSDSEVGRDVEGDARRHGEDSARDLMMGVRREVTKLSEKWATLRERASSMVNNISLAHKKLGVLQKTLEDVDGRLEAAEATVTSWGPVPQDPNLADQHVHNVTKFREGLSDLQRGVDDVNDQAARFSAHNVPLAPDTSTRLHRLNTRWKNLETAVNDRWRHVAGRSRDVTPLTAAQLASSVEQPWERAVANNKVPYYINHAQETTYWDHPEMVTLMDSLADLNHIKFSAYRTASKLRAMQKKLALDQASLQMVTDVFDEHGLRGQNDRLIDVSDMVIVLSTLYGRIASDRPEVVTSLTTDLCLNWLLNVYDSQRTGQMRVLSFRVGLVCLCKGHLEEKYRYMFRLIADPNRLVDQRKLGLLLHDCVQVPRQLGEVAAFGGSNIEPSVRSCFTKAGKDRDSIEAVHFLSWVQQEPQSLVWLAVLHRVAASEHIQHQVKCNICKTCPIVGLRYRCLKCIGFDMCQQCFFDGRSSKNHKITHPMHEYCTATTAGDEMKDFTKALKNKFKSKRSLQKHTKKGYLPVQTVLEGDPLESPSPSPQHGVASQDMHNRLELYASRLAEVELRTNSNSTPDSEDEHGLIAQYCQSLSSGDGGQLPVPRSPLQVMAAVDADQKDELEQMIRELEEENQALQAEYKQLKQQQDPSDSPSQSSGGSPLRSEAEMLAEARLLRQHKGRLEARMTILEQHNQQLEAQLHRLRQLLQQQNGSSVNKSGTLQTKSVTASQLATDSPAKVNGHSSQGDLERAVGSLVATVTHDQVRDLHSNAGTSAEGGEPAAAAAAAFPVSLQQQDEEIEQYDNNPMPAEKDR